jgi:hypothetical protein
MKNIQLNISIVILGFQEAQNLLGLGVDRPYTWM